VITLNDALHNKKIKNNIEAARRRLLCPLCGKHTVLWLLPDTEIKNLPIKCKRCGKETVVNVEPLEDAQKIIIAKEDSIP